MVKNTILLVLRKRINQGRVGQAILDTNSGIHLPNDVESIPRYVDIRLNIYKLSNLHSSIDYHFSYMLRDSSNYTREASHA